MRTEDDLPVERYVETEPKEAVKKLQTGRWSRVETKRSKAKSLIETTYTVYELHYTTGIYPNRLDLDYLSGGNESKKHIRGKLVLAEFFEKLGHEIPRDEYTEREKSILREAGEYEREWLYNGGFEVPRQTWRADVLCLSSGCTLRGEVGRFSPERFLRNAIEGNRTLVLLPSPPTVGPKSSNECEEYQIYVYTMRDAPLPEVLRAETSCG